MRRLLAALLMLPLLAFGQRYTVVSASSGGDIGDVIKRTALANIEFVAEYAPGGHGLIAPSRFAAKFPGRYLLMSGLMTQQVVGPRLHPELVGYTDADMTPVTLLAQTHFVVVAHRSVVFPNGRIAVAGSNAQFVARLIDRAKGVVTLQVPYRAIAQGVSDVSRGDVEFALVQVGTAQPFLQAGKVKLVAEFPDTPAAFGLYGQRGMSLTNATALTKLVVQALNTEFAKATYTQNYLQQPVEFGPEALRRFVAQQRQEFSGVLP